MKIRMDIDGPLGQQPKLIGMWIQGFGWVLGGAHSGAITIRGELAVDFDISAGHPPTIKKFMRRGTFPGQLG